MLGLNLYDVKNALYPNTEKKLVDNFIEGNYIKSINMAKDREVKTNKEVNYIYL
tara:strand:+ start:49 stop:210 length:162 start_codon:yes stop_codon:yes gene_type:complete